MDTALWINPLPMSAISVNKIKQLQIAKQVGFSAPKTLISNSSEQVVNFMSSIDRICMKGLTWTSFEVDGQYYPFFTIEVSKDEISKHLERLKYCPTLFQQYIDKVFDLRVTVFGKDIHAVEILSQENELARQDFRVVEPKNLIHKSHQLPDYICDKIRAFMGYFNLIYSAFDFAVTPMCHNG